MTDLHSRAKELIAEVGDGDAPTTAQKDSLRAAVLARVGATAVAGAAIGATVKTAPATAKVAAAGVAKASVGLGLTKVLTVLGIVGLAGVGYVAVSAISHPDNPAIAPVVTNATTPREGPLASPKQAIPSAPHEETNAVNPPAQAPPTPVVAAHPTVTPAADVEAETTALAGVLSTLRDKGPAEALQLLDRDDARFPHGALTEERTATRIDLLCALGREGEGRDARDRFLRTYPKSLLAGRVSAACGVATH